MSQEKSQLRKEANEVVESIFAFPGTGIPVSEELADYMGLDNGLSGPGIPIENIDATPLIPEGVYYGE